MESAPTGFELLEQAVAKLEAAHQRKVEAITRLTHVIRELEIVAYTRLALDGADDA